MNDAVQTLRAEHPELWDGLVQEQTPTPHICPRCGSEERAIICVKSRGESEYWAAECPVCGVYPLAGNPYRAATP